MVHLGPQRISGQFRDDHDDHDQDDDDDDDVKRGCFDRATNKKSCQMLAKCFRENLYDRSCR